MQLFDLKPVKNRNNINKSLSEKTKTASTFNGKSSDLLSYIYVLLNNYFKKYRKMPKKRASQIRFNSFFVCRICGNLAIIISAKLIHCHIKLFL